MRGSCTTSSVQVSITARLLHFVPSHIHPKYHWDYQIVVRNFRPTRITISSHRLFVHDSIGRIDEEHDYGITPDLPPSIHSGKSYTCTRQATTTGDSSILYGYLRIEDAGQMFSVDLPTIELRSQFHYATQALN